MPWWIPALIAGAGAVGSNIADRISSGKSEDRLQSIINEFIRPELSSSRKTRTDIERTFLGQVSDPEGYYRAAERAAGGHARELFKPGGEIASYISKARGGTIGSGFAPEAAEGPVRGILRAGTEQIANRFAQEAAGLEQSRLGALAGAYGQKEQSYMNLLSSLFTGQASVESLKAANRQQNKFLGLF